MLGGGGTCRANINVGGGGGTCRANINVGGGGGVHVGLLLNPWNR